MPITVSISAETPEEYVALLESLNHGLNRPVTLQAVEIPGTIENRSLPLESRPEALEVAEAIAPPKESRPAPAQRAKQTNGKTANHPDGFPEEWKALVEGFIKKRLPFTLRDICGSASMANRSHRINLTDWIRTLPEFSQGGRIMGIHSEKGDSPGGPKAKWTFTPYWYENGVKVFANGRPSDILHVKGAEFRRLSKPITPGEFYAQDKGDYAIKAI